MPPRSLHAWTPFGGYHAGYGTVGTVERYLIASNTWTTVQHLNENQELVDLIYEAYASTGHLLANGSLFLAGGMTPNGPANAGFILGLPTPPGDADYDGLLFAEEVVMGYDPFSGDTGHTGISDASKDWDGDRFSNLYEIALASSRPVGLANSLNAASVNTGLPVGAKPMSWHRRLSAGHFVNDQSGMSTLALFANWDIPTSRFLNVTGPIPFEPLSDILAGSLLFPEARFTGVDPGAAGQMRYLAQISSKGSPDETQNAELEEAKWWVHVEPALPFDTKHHFLQLKTTFHFGENGGQSYTTKEWSGKAVTIKKDEHDSEAIEVLSESNYPECVTVDNAGQPLETCKTDRTTTTYPISMLELSFNALPVNGLPRYLPVKNDGGQAYAPVWNDADGIGKPLAHYEKKGVLIRLNGMSEAVAFVAGSTPKIGGKVKANLGGAPAKLKGKCETIEGMDFPETDLEVDPTDGLLRFDQQQLTGTVGNQIKDYRSGVTFAWQVKVDGSDWIDIGKTTFRMYVTEKYHAHAAGAAFETVLRISCKGAAGQSGREAVRDGVWTQFEGASGNLARLDGKKLTYYKSWAVPYDNAANLLQYGDGQCGAFVHLFLSCIGVQGYAISDLDQGNITRPGLALAVKAFRADPPGRPTNIYGASLVWINSLLEGDIDGIELAPGFWSYRWQGNSEFEDEDGKAGQGSGNPKATFANHVIAQFDGDATIFDPSYGLKAPGGIAEWRTKSLDGYIKQLPSEHLGYVEWHFYKQIHPSLEAGIE